MKVVLLLLFVAAVGLGLGGALFPFGHAPLSLHAWLPSPVACAGIACVTYAQWHAAVERSTRQRSPEDVLNALLEQRAVAMVASKEGIRVSPSEVDQAIEAVRDTVYSIPGASRTLDEAYGAPFPGSVARDGLSSLLLREKLAALGTASPWESDHAPDVTVWNWYLTWDGEGKRIVGRSQ